MGTQGVPSVPMKGYLVGWFVRLSLRLLQEIFVLPVLLYSVQYKIFISSPFTFSHYLNV
jgi:hypothetical protein